jgi:hypothetical protein
MEHARGAVASMSKMPLDLVAVVEGAQDGVERAVLV